mmetsp:Transcript_108231/g.316550  ORF Transcript_108231/g.316550 Transcript_108231/m.316550 type:complete len:416 (-) Transcript_108231:182-1429(-)
MLKWQGDYTLPRLRAKLANKYLLHPDVEPDYAEVYRPDLSQTSIMRKENSLQYQAMRAEMEGTSTLARTAGSLLGQTRSSGLSAPDPTMRRTAHGGSQGFSDFRSSSSGGRERGMNKSQSVPTLGVRSMERAPAALQFPPAGAEAARTKEAPPTSVASPSADDKKALEKEQQAMMASRRLWTFAGGSELLIKTQLVILRDEDPKAANSALLQKLSKSPVLGMQIAMKQGAKVDWRNQEWDGATLLLKAVRTDSLPLAMYCLSQGADPVAVDNSGRGIFHWGAINGSPEIMGYLIDNYSEQVQVSTPDDGGDTPLHLAAYNGQLPVVRLLVRAGADPEAENAQGFTPFDLAQARRVWHVATYLTESRQHDEDRATKDSIQIKDLLRPCNIARASEVRAAAVQNPAKPKAKAKAGAK